MVFRLLVATLAVADLCIAHQSRGAAAQDEVSLTRRSAHLSSRSIHIDSNNGLRQVLRRRNEDDDGLDHEGKDLDWDYDAEEKGRLARRSPSRSAGALRRRSPPTSEETISNSEDSYHYPSEPGSESSGDNMDEWPGKPVVQEGDLPHFHLYRNKDGNLKVKPLAAPTGPYGPPASEKEPAHKLEGNHDWPSYGKGTTPQEESKGTFNLYGYKPARGDGRPPMYEQMLDGSLRVHSWGPGGQQFTKEIKPRTNRVTGRLNVEPSKSEMQADVNMQRQKGGYSDFDALLLHKNRVDALQEQGTKEEHQPKEENGFLQQEQRQSSSASIKSIHGQGSGKADALPATRERALENNHGQPGSRLSYLKNGLASRAQQLNGRTMEHGDGRALQRITEDAAAENPGRPNLERGKAARKALEKELEKEDRDDSSRKHGVKTEEEEKQNGKVEKGESRKRRGNGQHRAEWPAESSQVGMFVMNYSHWWDKMNPQGDDEDKKQHNLRRKDAEARARECARWPFRRETRDLKRPHYCDEMELHPYGYQIHVGSRTGLYHGTHDGQTQSVQHQVAMYAHPLNGQLSDDAALERVLKESMKDTRKGDSQEGSASEIQSTQSKAETKAAQQGKPPGSWKNPIVKAMARFS